MSIRDKVAIIGMGCCRFGEHWDKGVDDMIIDAVYEAYEDAGVDRKDIQAAWFGTAFSGIGGVSLAGPLKLDLSPGKILSEGVVKGPLLGGNLSIISHLTGTPFMPSLERGILFIEEKGEPLYRIDRMFTNLRLSGLLDNISGLIAGQFVDCGDSADINRLLLDITRGRNIPVFSGISIGHGEKNLTLPLGLDTELDTIRGLLSITDTCVEE